MKLFNDLKLKFEHPDWSRNPEFGLLDTILEQNPSLYAHLKDDIAEGMSPSKFGRKDTPTIEQIVRAAIFKELKGIDYRELEYAQSDSRICATFIKLDERDPFSFQVLQKFISKISAESLEKVLIDINQIAMDQGLESLESIRTDSTEVETNIHYPTNNSLVWDCIKESHRLLKHLKEETQGLSYRDYRRSAKKNHYKINNIKSKEKRVKLFHKQLTTFVKSINQVDQVVRNPKKKGYSLRGTVLIEKLKEHLKVMRKVYDVTHRKEIKGERVPNEEKIFSIYEPHTDIIVKGAREVKFGHKVNLTGGKSNLIVDCQIVEGNTSDQKLYKPSIENIENNYNILPKNVSVDGGYASKENMEYSQGKGIVNIVFNKVVGSLKSQATSQKMETMLKKWRSGIEAVISNFKRGYNMVRCNWKGKQHYKAKVLWSVIAYNVRTMTRLVLEKIINNDTAKHMG
ncbi:MAG: ISNCY family transposase [Flavobacteriales bacterium]